MKISSESSILTFGYGKGKCPARSLALIEIKLRSLDYCLVLTLVCTSISCVTVLQTETGIAVYMGQYPVPY